MSLLAFVTALLRAVPALLSLFEQAAAAIRAEQAASRELQKNSRNDSLIDDLASGRVPVNPPPPETR